jgi:hypothetical protein
MPRSDGVREEEQSGNSATWFICDRAETFASPDTTRNRPTSAALRSILSFAFAAAMPGGRFFVAKNG